MTERKNSKDYVKWILSPTWGLDQPWNILSEWQINLWEKSDSSSNLQDIELWKDTWWESFNSRTPWAIIWTTFVWRAWIVLSVWQKLARSSASTSESGNLSLSNSIKSLKLWEYQSWKSKRVYQIQRVLTGHCTDKQDRRPTAIKTQMHHLPAR